MFVYYLCLCDQKSRYGSLCLEVISLTETTEEDTWGESPRPLKRMVQEELQRWALASLLFCPHPPSFLLPL